VPDNLLYPLNPQPEVLASHAEANHLP